MLWRSTVSLFRCADYFCLNEMYNTFKCYMYSTHSIQNVCLCMCIVYYVCLDTFESISFLHVVFVSISRKSEQKSVALPFFQPMLTQIQCNTTKYVILLNRYRYECGIDGEGAPISTIFMQTQKLVHIMLVLTPGIQQIFI